MERCRFKDCDSDSEYEVVLYDVYPLVPDLFREQHYSCPYIRLRHMAENEKTAKGVRKPEGNVQYKYTNRSGVLGFTI